MKLFLIRHGMTKGNLESRYIGTTDEPLCAEGIAKIQSNKEKHRYPKQIQCLAVSPMIRCRETAELIFPGIKQDIVADFRETDFGLFENKNYKELSGTWEYEQWLGSNGTLPFPNGESREDFSRRCSRAFESLKNDWMERGVETGALVVHGGTIMAILSHQIPSDFYTWQVKNGDGFCLILEGTHIEIKPLFE